MTMWYIGAKEIELACSQGWDVAMLELITVVWPLVSTGVVVVIAAAEKKARRKEEKTLTSLIWNNSLVNDTPNDT